jgi:hypothetical protein
MVLMKKTYDPEIDQLIQELKSTWDGGPSAGYAMVVDETVAERAADMIFLLYERLASFEADYYNRQMGDY